jgi:17beta-estradiol 17-dehydrogenase / 3beta-hydroxysteroid 3-dehydrogenase
MKTVLVTGVTSGIGLAIARRLIRAGYRVAGCGRREERLSEINADLGPSFLGIQCDLRQKADIEDMFETLQEVFGGIDVLVNNAGLGHHSPLLSGEYQLWEEMMSVNVLALSQCTKLGIRQMEARGSYGYVIHISSMAGHRVPEESGMYSATKYAVRSLTESLRRELRSIGSEVRISAISPGFVETEFAEHYHKSQVKAAETYRRYPVLQPDDIAEQVHFLLEQPTHVQIHDLLVRPTKQES